MSVVKSKQKLSRFEAQHHFYQLRNEVTLLVLNDFGFSPEKYEKAMTRYEQCHAGADNLDDVLARWKTKNDSFTRWFIDNEGKVVLDLLREIEREFTLGNSIYPSVTPAKLFEFIERRKHMNRAIGLCWALKQEMNYIIRTLPVDLNRFTHFATEIDKQIALYKGVRQADNRLLKGGNNIAQKAESVFDVFAAAMQEIGRYEQE